MDGDDAVLRQEPLLLQLLLDVVERIAVLSEDDYFSFGSWAKSSLKKLVNQLNLLSCSF